ncbi:MAG: GNAT family N-acetyltransferase [Candidatus Acidiferrales bacterium]
MLETRASIRTATPSDSDFLGWAILIAARSQLDKGWFDIVLEGTESARLNFLRRLTLTSARSWWHYSRFFVAEIDGARAAALSAFRAGEAYPLSQAAMSEVAKELGCSEAEKQAMWKRGAYIFGCTLDTDQDAWTIENVATAPRYRGRGIAGQLLDHAIAEAQRNGAHRAQVTFLMGNDAAERAYSKAGFMLADERQDAAFEAACGAPGLRRYTRDL